MRGASPEEGREKGIARPETRRRRRYPLSMTNTYLIPDRIVAPFSRQRHSVVAPPGDGIIQRLLRQLRRFGIGSGLIFACAATPLPWQARHIGKAQHSLVVTIKHTIRQRPSLPHLVKPGLA